MPPNSDTKSAPDRSVRRVAPASSDDNRPRKQVSRYTPEAREALDAFKRSVFEKDSLPCDSDYFHWYFDKHPHRRGQGDQLWIYRSGASILGQLAGLPVRLKVGDRELAGSWATDLIVAPAHRKKGIGALLCKRCIEDNDVTMGVGISDAAYRVHRRSGWIDLGDVPLFVRPLDMVDMLTKRGHPIVGRLIGAVVNLAFSGLELWPRIRSIVAGIRFEEINRFDERVDEIWRSVSPHYKVIARRDCRYLNWRFVDQPFKGRYRQFLLRRGGEVLGYAVLRQGRRHGLTAGYVVDFLCAPGHIGAMFGACIQVVRDWGCSVLYCLHVGPSTGRRLTWLGFARRKSDARLMAKPNGVDEDVKRLLGDRGNWFVTAGDSDADRPTV